MMKNEDGSCGWLLCWRSVLTMIVTWYLRRGLKALNDLECLSTIFSSVLFAGSRQVDRKSSLCERCFHDKKNSSCGHFERSR